MAMFRSLRYMSPRKRSVKGSSDSSDSSQEEKSPIRITGAFKLARKAKKKYYQWGPRQTYFPITCECLPTYIPPKENICLEMKKIKVYPEGSWDMLSWGPVPRTFLTTNLAVQDGIFSVGDLVWAKAGCWPYWPAMISAEPALGQYCQVLPGGHYTQIMYYVYFVQYFGKVPTFGWINAIKLTPFKGYQALLQQLTSTGEHECNSDKAGSRNQQKLYNWNQAVCEAELALKLSQQERIDLLTYNYVKGEDEDEEEDEEEEEEKEEEKEERSPSRSSTRSGASSKSGKAKNNNKAQAKTKDFAQKTKRLNSQTRVTRASSRRS